MSRFTDIDFSDKKLPSIDNYRRYPLVSLQQSLEPIVSRIDQLPRHIVEAMQHCHYPSEHGLTRDESAAVYLYTMELGNDSFHRLLNQALRCDDRQALKPWFPYLKLIATALDKLPTVKRKIWRGTNGDIGENLKRNKILTWWGVSSCSLSVDVIKNFLGINGTLFLIEAVNGKNISGYTKYSNENEVLLEPGTQLRVTSDAWDHGRDQHVVYLVEVINDDHEQLLSGLGTVQLVQEVSDEIVSDVYEFWKFVNVLVTYLTPTSNQISADDKQRLLTSKQQDNGASASLGVETSYNWILSSKNKRACSSQRSSLM